MFQGPVKCNKGVKTTCLQPLTAPRVQAYSIGGRRRRKGEGGGRGGEGGGLADGEGDAWTFSANLSITGESNQCACIFQPFCIKAPVDQPHREEAIFSSRARARVCGHPLVSTVVPRPTCTICEARTRVQIPSTHPYLNIHKS